MAQLNLFNGGLNTRLAPHLLNVNEAVVYENIDTTSNILKPLKIDKDMETAISSNIYNFKDAWISTNEYRDYIEFQEKLYYTNGVGIPQKSDNGTIWKNLGIVKPSSSPSVSLGSTTTTRDGVYQYCYTYYNSSDGSESMPSDNSPELTVTLLNTLVTVVASTDTQVTNIRIYRIGGKVSVMSLVVELPNTSTTYNDILGDLSIEGDVLTSQLYGQAPSGLKYLTEVNAMFFGALKDKLYFSEIAYPNAWSPFNFIDFNSDITGIGVTPSGLLVFTKYKTYIVTGNSPETLSKYLLNGSQGCILHKSIKYIGNTLVWLSSDGLCASNGGDIQVVTREKLNKLVFQTPKDAAVLDDIYYITHSTGTFIFDSRFGSVNKLLSTKYDSLHVYNDELYGSSNGKLYKLLSGYTNHILHYKSPRIMENSLTTIKSYKNIYVNSSGNLELKTYLDGNLVNTKQLTNGFEEIKLPQVERLAYYIEFEVTGTGELYEIEYKVEGRQNGR